MTTIRRVTFDAGVWVPRGGLAVMPITVAVAGRAESLVPDLCRELERLIPWAKYGENLIPADAAPQATLTKAAGEHVDAGLVVELNASQPAPDYEDGAYAGGDVRINLVQPMTTEQRRPRHAARPAARRGRGARRAVRRDRRVETRPRVGACPRLDRPDREPLCRNSSGLRTNGATA